MTVLKWDQVSERTYETGVDHGVLYVQDTSGAYPEGVPWNGLVSVTESPSGAESSPQYADNIKYLNLVSAEEFGGTIEAFTYPDEFMVCDGTAELAPGVYAGQQTRRSFGMVYRTKIGNDVLGQGYGYKLHLLYGCMAAPSEKAYKTINDSPEALTFSWALTTTAVDVPGYTPTSVLTIDSTKVDPADLKQLEDALFGTSGTAAHLPNPDYVASLFAGAVSVIETVDPTYNAGTKTISLPATTGVVWKVDGVTKSGNVVITKDAVVRATPANGYAFTPESDTDWTYRF